MITLNWISTPEQIAAKLNGTRQNAIDSLARQMRISMGTLREYIVSTKLSGFPLKHRTGNLIRSTQPSTSQTTGQIAGKVSVDNTAFYGKIHEYGGSFTARRTLKLPPHLARRQSGERVMTGTPYGIFFPERSFMRTSLAENRQTIITALATALNRAIKQ
jgi:phage gpG-like protein